MTKTVLKKFNTFANAIVGSCSIVPELGSIYWCSVSTKKISGYKDSSGFSLWATVSKDPKTGKCKVQDSKSERVFNHNCMFDKINRSELAVIATKLGKTQAFKTE